MYLDKSEKEIPQFSASVPNLALLFALVTPIIFFGIYFTPIIDLARNSLVFFGF
jgi:hypothetical protein